MSELKFEDIKVGDQVRDLTDNLIGKVISVGMQYVKVDLPGIGPVTYSDIDFLSPSSLEIVKAKIESVHDAVTAPQHYNLPNGLQVIDLTKNESFLRGNVLKYVFRAPHKGNELEDLLKARQYLNWEIERVEKESK